MKKSRPFSFFILAFLLLTCIKGHSQVYTNKEVGKKNEVRTDSVKNTPYKYVLPIFGKKAAARGFELPYSAGISVNYFWQQSDLVIDNLKVGFNEGEMYDLDGLVRFDKAKSTAQSINIRPDFWLFPFLDVYGIFGRTMASTDVGFGVWIQDSTNTEKEIMHAESKVDFTATTIGFGLTPTFGVGGFWIAVDMNFSWTDVPQLSKPAFSFILGPRFGKTFRFKKPGCSLAVWGGAFRVAINSGTDGSINLSDVLPVGQLQSQVQQGYLKVDSAQQQVNTWWSNLSPQEQKNPVNVAKYNAANASLTKAGQVLNAAETAVNNAAGSTVQYSMDKEPKNKWNLIVGSQFQLNKHWMVRAEGGFLGSRYQVTCGLQYRFGL